MAGPDLMGLIDVNVGQKALIVQIAPTLIEAYGVIIRSPDEKARYAVAFIKEKNLFYTNLMPGMVTLAESREYGFHGKLIYLHTKELEAKPLQPGQGIEEMLNNQRPWIPLC